MIQELIERLRQDSPSQGSIMDEAADRIMELERELEREQMRLVACGVVAMCDTPESAEKARQMHPDYESASCSDVARRVDECIELRKRIEAQQSWIASLEQNARDADRMYKELEVELGAAQAQLKVMREALEAVRDQRINGYVFPAVVDLDAWHSKVINALAQPTDTTALREMLAQERERCAEMCDRLGDEYADANAADCADNIRAMGSE